MCYIIHPHSSETEKTKSNDTIGTVTLHKKI